MLQVLLHFLFLSYPYDSTSQSGDKKRKRRSKKKAEPKLDHQANLDMLADRLCIWRETEFALSDEHLPSSSTFSATSERDWLQRFCEDVVRPAFAANLPPLYESFRMKCFPELSADIDDTETDEPTQAEASGSRLINRVPRSRQESIEPSNSHLRPDSLMVRKRSGSSGHSDALAAPLAPRTFSRSNSVVSNAGGANSQLLAANSRREVSMRRSMSVQRDPSIGPSAGTAGALKGKGKEKAMGTSAKQVGRGNGTFAADATRPGRSSSFSNRQNTQPPPHLYHAKSQPAPLKPPPTKFTTTLVPETPNRSRTFGRAATMNDLGGGRPGPGWAHHQQYPDPARHESMFDDDPFGLDDDGEDATMFFTSEPDSGTETLGNGGSLRGRAAESGGNAILVQSTPVRPRAASVSSGVGYGGRGAPQGIPAGSTLPLMIPETPSK